MERNVVIRVTCLFLLCIHYVFAFNHLQPQHFHRRQFYGNDDDDNDGRQVERQQLENNLPLFHSWQATNESRIFYIRSSALGNEWITATTDESTIIDNDLLETVPDVNSDDETDDSFDDEDELDNGGTDMYNLFHRKNRKQQIFPNHNPHKKNRDDFHSGSKRQNKHHGKISHNKFNDLNIINDTNLTRSNVRHIASRYRRQHSSDHMSNNNKRYKGKRRKKRLRSVPDWTFINKHQHQTTKQTIHWPIKKEAVIEGKSSLLMNLILFALKMEMGHR